MFLTFSSAEAVNALLMVDINQEPVEGVDTVRTRPLTFQSTGPAPSTHKSCYVAQKNATSNMSRTKAHTFIFKLSQGARGDLEYCPGTMNVNANNRPTIRNLIGIVLIPFLLGSEIGCAEKELKPDEVLKKYSGLMVQVGHLDREVAEYVATQQSTASTGVIHADLDGDGVNDIAILTKNIDDKALTLRFYLCNGTCRAVERISLGEFNGLQFLAVVPPGQSIEEARSFNNERASQKLESSRAAIRYNVFGKTHVTYFWDSQTRSIHSVTTGD